MVNATCDTRAEVLTASLEPIEKSLIELMDLIARAESQLKRWRRLGKIIILVYDLDESYLHDVPAIVPPPYLDSS